MSTKRRENINSIISILSLLLAIVAIIYSFKANEIAGKSNEIAERNLEIIQKPLMRAVMEYESGEIDKAVVSIYNDGPVLTDFDIEPTRFLLINNSVIIPTGLEDEMWSRSVAGETQGLITTLDHIGIYDFMRRSNLTESDYDLREKNEEPFWYFTEYNILLKITYSDVFHEESEVFLMMTQTETRGEFIESADANKLLKIIKSNKKKLIKEVGSYRNVDLQQLLLKIKKKSKNYKVLDRATFNRLPFKYSESNKN